MRRHAGFTLLEVLLAVFVLATAMSGLITLVSQNLAGLADAALETRVERAAEARMRELVDGDPLPAGSSDGAFEGDDADLHWLLVVEPYSVPLPEGYEHDANVPGPPGGSSIFAEPNQAPDAPQPSVQQLSLYVHHELDDPESSEPFVVFRVDATTPALFDSASGQASGGGR